MPELAEVEYYRKRWNCGVGETVIGVRLHEGKRVFRNVPVGALRDQLPGATLLGSEASGKQLLFRFSNDLWLGVHLGMTGKLSVAAPGFEPGRHDHLVLDQEKRALVFSDPRLFGRVQFQSGSAAPDWWVKLPPAVNSPGFTRSFMRRFVARHSKLPIKAVLLLQSGFAGIGNWMADETLWRARLNPLRLASELAPEELEKLWQQVRWVCRGALRHIGRNFDDLPQGWLFLERWEAGGRCPVHPGERLKRQAVRGRTTVWCSRCQPLKSKASVRPGVEPRCCDPAP